MTRLVVGLGNPGPEYQGTRHNIGFDVLDHLALHEGLLFRSARHLDGLTVGAPPTEGGGPAAYRGPRAFSFARMDDVDALLVKPETFMNRSGEVVAAVARFLGWGVGDVGRMLVVYDDLDLDPSRLRLRPHGGTGGHNGMRSIIQHLGSDRFPRLRVGIGRPGTDAARYVLGRFTEQERVDMDIAVRESAEAIVDWLRTGDIEGCMTRYHSRWNQGLD